MFYWKWTLLLILCTSVPVMAEEPTKGPLIKRFGPVFEVPEASLKLDTKVPLRVVFDVGSAPDSKAELNRRIESVARYMNMHARAGYSAEQMEIAVVLHGSASWNALSDEAYRKRFGEANPNTELIAALRAYDVDFWLCGQSAGFNGINSAELSSEIGLSLSAMTALQQLQTDGYALIP